MGVTLHLVLQVIPEYTRRLETLHLHMQLVGSVWFFPRLCCAIISTTVKQQSGPKLDQLDTCGVTAFGLYIHST